MQIYYFDDLSSTSDWAAQKIKDEKISVPFAVVARCQSKGRGRSGHHWESQPGGLYLTLCYPVDLKKLQSPGSVTLLVGELVADYLKERWGVIASLKWPNDLYVNGLKLAGILTESLPLFSQNETYMLLVGIGINISNPVAQESGRTSVAELSPLLKQGDFEFDYKKSAKDFVNYFDAIFRERIEEDFSAKSWLKNIRSGFRLWWDQESGDLFRITAVKKSGELILRNVFQKKHRKILSSSHHNFYPFALKPFGLGNKDFPVIHLWLVDQGNTSTKIYSCIQGSVDGLVNFQKAARLVHESMGDHWQSFAEEHLNKDAHHLFFVISVHKPYREQLRDLISEKKSCAFLRVRKIPCRLRSQYPMRELGIDRLAIMEGALAQRDIQSQSGVLLASSGTALTVDAIDSTHQHMGGWICPGFDMQLSALHQGTNALPALELKEGLDEKFSSFLGTNTATSMRNGVVFSMNWALSFLKLKLEEQENCEFILNKLGFWPHLEQTKIDETNQNKELMALGIWQLTCG